MRFLVSLVFFFVHSNCFVNAGQLDLDFNGCPTFEQVPISRSTGDTWPIFLGGRLWVEPGNDVPELACNGDFYDEDDGYMHSADNGQCSVFGSVIVNAGCSLKIFEDIGICNEIYEAVPLP